MAKAAWGIEFGSRALRAVRMVRDGAEVGVEGIEEIPYAETEGGDVQSAPLEALEELQERRHLGTDPVVISIPGRSVFTKLIKLPPVEPRRIPEIVRYESRQVIPFPIEEVIWDYQPLDRDYAPGEEIEVMIVAVRRDVLAETLALCREAGIEPDGVQATPLALYNFIRYDLDPEETTVVVDVGAENTELLVIDEARYWPRNIATAGDKITQALQEKFQIPFEEAEGLKRKAGASRQAEKLFGVMQPVFRTLLREIQQSLGFYKSQHEGVKFDRILAMGDTFRLQGLDDLMGKQLRYPVVRLDGTRRIHAAGGLDDDVLGENVDRYAIAMGLALQGLGVAPVGLSLIPPETVRAKGIARKKPYALAAATLLLVSSAVSYAVGSVRRQEATRIDDEAETFLASVGAVRNEVESVSDLQSLRDRLAAMERIGRDPRTRLERDIDLKVLGWILWSVPLKSEGSGAEVNFWIKGIDVRRGDVPAQVRAQAPGLPERGIRVELQGYFRDQGGESDNRTYAITVCDRMLQVGRFDLPGGPRYLFGGPEREKTWGLVGRVDVGSTPVPEWRREGGRDVYPVDFTLAWGVLPEGVDPYFRSAPQ